jgi:rhodanese-related sulfurtransferase
MKSALKVHLCLALALFFVMSGLASAHTNVSAVLAKALIDSKNPPLLVDVREPSEYCGPYGHIEGALNYPYSSDVLREKYTDFDPEQPIMVICQSGGRSNSAANFLDARGFTTVYDILGGMRNWPYDTVGCEDPVDSDQDGIYDEEDNCPDTYNPGQGDADEDGVGNVCDPDFPNLYVIDRIDFKDFAVFARAWSMEGESLAADLDKNGTVDYGDLAILAENWLCE